MHSGGLEWKPVISLYHLTLCAINTGSVGISITSIYINTGMVYGSATL